MVGADDAPIPLRLLSDGQRSITATVTDIARRALTLNRPVDHLPLNEVPGLILIDEVDLHLHPSWQRRVLSDLARTFAGMQFIVTTHSPFILQSSRDMPEAQVVDLNEFADHGPVQQEGIEAITERTLGVPDVHRSPRYAELKRAATEH